VAVISIRDPVDGLFSFCLPAAVKGMPSSAPIWRTSSPGRTGGGTLNVYRGCRRLDIDRDAVREPIRPLTEARWKGPRRTDMSRHCLGKAKGYPIRWRHRAAGRCFADRPKHCVVD
jgi:hypothetical protein